MHLLKRPVVKKIQSGEEENFRGNEKGEPDNKPAIHVRVAGSAACIASSAWTGTAGGTANPLRVMR